MWAYVEEVVEVIPVFVIVETTTVFANLATIGVASWFENESWLEEDLACVLVDLLEPVPQPLVSVCVIVQHIDRILDLVHTLSVGKPFEKRPQLPGGLAKGGILGTSRFNGCERGTLDDTLALATPWDSE